MPSKCVCGEEKARHIDGEMRDRIYKMTTRGAVTVCSGFQAMATRSFVEAAIRRMSPQQRGKLKRRLANSAKGWGWDSRIGSPDHPDSVKAAGNANRFTAMLGRFSALTAGLEVL